MMDLPIWVRIKLHLNFHVSPHSLYELSISTVVFDKEYLHGFSAIENKTLKFLLLNWGRRKGPLLLHQTPASWPLPRRRLCLHTCSGHSFASLSACTSAAEWTSARPSRCGRCVCSTPCVWRRKARPPSATMSFSFRRNLCSKCNFWITSSTHQVHHDVFVEGVPPLSCHLAHIHHGLRVVCVHMEDGSVDDPCYVCGVRGWACHPGVCGETDLCW